MKKNPANPNDIKIGMVAIYNDKEVNVLYLSSNEELATIMQGRHAIKVLTKDLIKPENFELKNVK